VYYNATRAALTEANRYAKAEADKLQAELERREMELLLKVARRETELALESARREIIEKEHHTVRPKPFGSKLSRER
jgi:hypothetical protein